MATLNEFKREYVKAIQEGYAAVFAGSGLSRPSGYVDWKTLLKEVASDINLDIEKEHDLTAVAQYYCNEKKGRDTLNSLIINSFVTNSIENDNVNLLVQMPIETYWTTNYDSLLEDTMKKHGKIIDIKIQPRNLASTLEEKDAIIYKMHGDHMDPAFCVITKDDYESYSIHRQLFSTALQGDLISKTFLFIGFSFNDPNLSYILSRIRILLNENKRQHYCLIEKVKRKKFKSKKEYDYAVIKQNLQIQDLLRYSINAVMLDDYSEITQILEDIKRSAKNKNVFISGSAQEYGPKWNDSAITLIRNLSQMLFNNNLKVVTGHARGIGSYIVSTILHEINSKRRKMDKHLDIKAFPYQDKGNENYKSIVKQYRQDIFNQCGIAIFLFGNKLEDDKIINAPGGYQEYLIAKQNNCFIIPIGSTGYVAHEIFSEIKENKKEYSYLNPYLDILENSDDPELITGTVQKIIDDIRHMI